MTLLPPAAAGLAAAAAAHTRAVPKPHRRAVGRVPGGWLPRRRRSDPRLPHSQYCSTSIGAAACGALGGWVHALQAGRLRPQLHPHLGHHMSLAFVVAIYPDLRTGIAYCRWCLRAATTGCTWRSRPPSIALCVTSCYTGCRRYRRPTESDSIRAVVGMHAAAVGLRPQQRISLRGTFVWGHVHGSVCRSVHMMTPNPIAQGTANFGASFRIAACFSRTAKICSGDIIILRLWRGTRN